MHCSYLIPSSGAFVSYLVLMDSPPVPVGLLIFHYVYRRPNVSDISLNVDRLIITKQSKQVPVVRKHTR